MGYKMKRGSAPKYKELGSSPAKEVTGWDKAKRIGMGYATGGILGGIGAATTMGKMEDEDKYADVLAEEGLERNFWGKLGFGGKRSRERDRRIEELKRQDSAGINRERIQEQMGGTVGP